MLWIAVLAEEKGYYIRCQRKTETDEYLEDKRKLLDACI